MRKFRLGVIRGNLSEGRCSFGSKNCRAFVEVVSWDSNVHQEATAVCPGGKLTTGSHIGVILGPRLAILWVMLKLSRAMVSHAAAICQMLVGHVLGFVSQSAPPEAPRF